MDASDDSPITRLRTYTTWFLTTDTQPAASIREFTRTIFITILIIAILFAISGVWPPMVSIESGSMEPDITRGDLIYIVEEPRYSSDDNTHANTGVVTHRTGSETGYKSFNGYGDVIIYHPNGDQQRIRIIHRSMFWVNESENWYSKANPKYLDGENCGEVPNCPAPHDGFITKGDANDHYDQVKHISTPVRPEWVVGTAEVKIPYLGYVRLAMP